ncbi:FAD binding domain-containing protein [Mycena galopus ATCC 62051]|nr:FAD binding domain-containing protein [Mycena galopus ATCC 62051]
MTTAPIPRTIVVGGGLAGLSAAHTLLERGKSVLLLDKKPSLGGNSVKASSGINGAGTEAQRALEIQDSAEVFSTDTANSAGPELARPALITALTANSASAIVWLTDTFNVDLSVVSRLGGHTVPRTHRDKSGAPGWAITSALMKKLTALAAEPDARVEIVKNARVIQLLQDGGGVVGVEYEGAEGLVSAHGNVVLATGGYAADASPTGLLAQHCPELLALATTNGDHATGDGLRLALAAGAAACDLAHVQVHPTGFVDPAAPGAKTKFLAAEALRGAGGLLLDAQGARFVKEVERRDVVTAAMQGVEGEGRGPVRLVLGERAAAEVKSHCAFYVGKGLMKRYPDAAAFASDTGIPLENILATFAAYGGAGDPFGSGVTAPATATDAYTPTEALHVAIITPVVHYTMGGLAVSPSARVLSAATHAPIPGLWAAGEVIGGVHGRNRLAGSSLLEAVVFGRVAGEGAGVGIHTAEISKAQKTSTIAIAEPLRVVGATILGGQPLPPTSPCVTATTTDAYTPTEPLHVAIITPVVHYTMGGLTTDASARALSASADAPIPGLWAAGEVIGGVHERNRLAGSSLLEAVVFGRVVGEGAGV